MQLTDFYERVNNEFGEVLGSFYIRNTVLVELSSQTAIEAIEAGIDPKNVWLALCREFQVPPSQW